MIKETRANLFSQTKHVFANIDAMIDCEEKKD